MLRFTSRIKIKQASVTVKRHQTTVLVLRFTALSHETELSLSSKETSEDAASVKSYSSHDC